MLELKERIGAAILLITHDLGVVAETCQRVIVMYAGRTVEEAPVLELFDRPAHPYTRGLLASIPPARGRRREAAAGDPGRRCRRCVSRSSAAPSRRAARWRSTRCRRRRRRSAHRAGHRAACWRGELAR